MCATSHIWNPNAMSQRAYKSTNHPQEFTRHPCVSELFCPIWIQRFPNIFWGDTPRVPDENGSKTFKDLRIMNHIFWNSPPFILLLPFQRVWAPDMRESTVFCGPAEVIQHDVVVAAAEHPSLHQAELLSGGQLPLTGETGETGQMVHAAPSPAHPVAGIHLPATLGALGAKPTVSKENEGGGHINTHESYFLGW